MVIGATVESFNGEKSGGATCVADNEGADKKGVLSAECQQRDGSWVKSALKYDIANNNGVLMWAPAGID